MHGALPRLGFEGITESARASGSSSRSRASSPTTGSPQIHEVAEKLLSNPVIEDFEQ